MRPTDRFSARQLAYDRGRPRYPSEAIDRMLAELDLRAGDRCVELGSGTGILTEPLVERGLRVHAVEPNADMRAIAEARLGDRIDSIAAPAEATTLPDRCARAAIAAQAFHWFDVSKTRAEMIRVLDPPHRLALLWNSRDEHDPSTAELAHLIDRHGKDVGSIGHRGPVRDRKIESFFVHGFEHARFEHVQRLDWDELCAFLASASYLPRLESSEAAPLIAEARAWHDAHATGGVAPIRYATDLYCGALGQA